MLPLSLLFPSNPLPSQTNLAIVSETHPQVWPEWGGGTLPPPPSSGPPPPPGLTRLGAREACCFFSPQMPPSTKAKGRGRPPVAPPPAPRPTRHGRRRSQLSPSTVVSFSQPPTLPEEALAALADQVTSRVLAWIRATAFSPNSFSSSKNRPSPRTNQIGTRPRGVCFTYNSSGAFCHNQNCRFRHKCSLCFRGHPRYKCKSLTTDPTTRPGPRADKLRIQHIPPTTPNNPRPKQIN